MIEKNKGHGFELGVESKTHIIAINLREYKVGLTRLVIKNFLKSISILSNPRPQEQESVSFKPSSSSKRWADPNRQKNLNLFNVKLQNSNLREDGISNNIKSRKAYLQFSDSEKVACLS